jgi:HAD superfamily hydrolase (TIGR01450 family)
MLSILNEYDVFLVDAYGVFWDGSNFIEGTKDTLKALVENGKFVIILSNTTQRSTPAIEKYAKLGLIQGKHYHELITSGEVARTYLEKGLALEGSPKKYYTFGTANHSLFEGLEYEPVPLEKAEFIYIGIPQFTNAQKISIDGKYPLYESCLSQAGQAQYWDTTEISAFSTIVEELANTSLPVLNANPDLMAPEKCKTTQTLNFVVRQGYIAKKLEEKKVKIQQFGKPYNQVYEFCRNLLQKELKNSRVVMIGDTVETDILGAHNAKIQLNWQVDSILTLTGNAVCALQEKDNARVALHLKGQFQQFGCKPTHIITSFGSSDIFTL